MKKRRTQSLNFWSNFDQQFPAEDGQNRKTAIAGKNFSHWAIQICENQGSISSHLSEKTFRNSWETG